MTIEVSLPIEDVPVADIAAFGHHGNNNKHMFGWIWLDLGTKNTWLGLNG